MSPEQARGRPVDKRTDVWAFGCVLYEMLTGRLAFPGDTLSDTIAAILQREPDWQALPDDDARRHSAAAAAVPRERSHAAAARYRRRPPRHRRGTDRAGAIADRCSHQPPSRRCDAGGVGARGHCHRGGDRRAGDSIPSRHARERRATVRFTLAPPPNIVLLRPMLRASPRMAGGWRSSRRAPVTTPALGPFTRCARGAIAPRH